MKNILKVLLSGFSVLFIIYYLNTKMGITDVIFNQSISEGIFIPAIIFIILIIIIFIIFYKSFSLIIDGFNFKIWKKVILGIIIIVCTILSLFILIKENSTCYDCGYPNDIKVTPCVPSLENNYGQNC